MTTPQPPQGGNPFGQQPQGGNPYGQGGPMPQPSPYTNQGGGFPPPAPQPNRGGGKKALRTIVGIVVVVAIAVAIFLFGRSDTQTSAVGDCFENKGSDFSPKMEKVDCSAPNAEYKVVSKHEDTTDQQKCDLEGGQAAYTETVNGKASLLLCLEPLK